MMNLTTRPNKYVSMLLALMLIGAIGVVDYFTGYKISFSIFYLIPILFVTWYVSRLNALIMSFLGTFIWFLADYLARPEGSLEVGVIFWNAMVRLAFFLIIVVSISNAKGAFLKEQTLLRTDFLTNIANRMGFIERLKLEVDRAKRNLHPFSLVYIDCDNFKQINDDLGHLVGDKLLGKIASIINNNIRSTDLCARIGGDEYSIIFPETDGETAMNIINRIRIKLSMLMNEMRCPVTFSIGVVTFVRPAKSLDEAIGKADRLMYSVKKNGKDGIKHKYIT